LSTSPLRIEVADYIALVTLDHPPVNAQNRPLRQALLEAFDTLGDRDDVRVIVLTGAGRTFSAGADIKERIGLVQGPGDYTRHNRLTRESFYAIIECPKPVIAAINGPALGAGFALAQSCDILLASENAIFGMPEVDVGLAGGAKFLQRFLSHSKARRMLLTGQRVSAQEMYRLGVIEACTAPEALMPEAMAIAREIAGKSPLAVRLLKQSFNMVDQLSLRDGYRLEQDITVQLSKTDDAKEAQRAFVEKRKPVFKGR
jgi:enoyl-CoA hydratase